MLWQGRRESSNVEDRRGISGRGIAAGGGIGTLIIGLLYFLLGGNPSDINSGLGPATTNTICSAKNAEEEKLASFSKVILGGYRRCLG
jgi:predicted metalloprotease